MKGSEVVSPEQPSESCYLVTKAKARENEVLCKDDPPAAFPDCIVNSHSKIQACGRGS